jgi:hypothetical protein
VKTIVDDLHLDSVVPNSRANAYPALVLNPSPRIRNSFPNLRYECVVCAPLVRCKHTILRSIAPQMHHVSS